MIVVVPGMLFDSCDRIAAKPEQWRQARCVNCGPHLDWLEQQWDNPAGVTILQISSTLHYTQTLTAAVGSRVSDITVA